MKSWGGVLTAALEQYRLERSETGSSRKDASRKRQGSYQCSEASSIRKAFSTGVENHSSTSKHVSSPLSDWAMRGDSRWLRCCHNWGCVVLANGYSGSSFDLDEKLPKASGDSIRRTSAGRQGTFCKRHSAARRSLRPMVGRQPRNPIKFQTHLPVKENGIRKHLALKYSRYASNSKSRFGRGQGACRRYFASLLNQPAIYSQEIVFRSYDIAG